MNKQKKELRRIALLSLLVLVACGPAPEVDTHDAGFVEDAGHSHVGSGVVGYLGCEGNHEEAPTVSEES